jgi:hypothetical protein
MGTSIESLLDQVNGSRVRPPWANWKDFLSKRFGVSTEWR